ncbi:hypothetical protein DESACE_03660 [Desulfurella acetivorans A63]|nr:hypothetical protein DESACE_03660 [Desulfurella acetivorans A63]
MAIISFIITPRTNKFLADNYYIELEKNLHIYEKPSVLDLNYFVIKFCR